MACIHLVKGNESSIVVSFPPPSLSSKQRKPVFRISSL
jgi:hypothetical protein